MTETDIITTDDNTELRNISADNTPAIWADEEACKRALRVCRQMALAGIGGDIEWTGDPAGDKALLDQRTSELFTKLAYGADIGMPPSTAMAAVFITEGKPNIGAQDAMAVCEARGAFAPGTKPEIVFDGIPLADNWSCEVTTQPAGSTTSVTTKRYWKDIKVFGKTSRGTKPAYAHSAESMLLWRTYGLHCKTYYKAYLGGMMMREDVQDARVIKNVTPVKHFVKADKDPALAINADIEETTDETEDTGTDN